MIFFTAVVHLPGSLEGETIRSVRASYTRDRWEKQGDSLGETLRINPVADAHCSDACWNAWPDTCAHTPALSIPHTQWVLFLLFKFFSTSLCTISYERKKFLSIKYEDQVCLSLRRNMHARVVHRTHQASDLQLIWILCTSTGVTQYWYYPSLT